MSDNTVLSILIGGCSIIIIMVVMVGVNIIIVKLDHIRDELKKKKL